MQRGRGLEVSRQDSAAEAVKLFLIPPLLTFALIAFSLLLFTSHLAQRDLQTTFVVESARHVVGSAPGADRAPAH
jgi:hypothetical protein